MSTRLNEFHKLHVDNRAFYCSKGRIVCHVARLPESEQFGDLIELYCKLIKRPMVLVVVADDDRDVMRHPMVRQFSQCDDVVKDVQVVSDLDNKPEVITLPDAAMSQLTVQYISRAHDTVQRMWAMHITPALRNSVIGIACVLLAVGQSTTAQTTLAIVFASFLLSLAGASFWSAYHSFQAAATLAKTNELAPTLQQQDRLWAVISNSRICSSVVGDVHVEYRLDLRYDGKSWSVWRRYNDFARLVRESPLAKDLDGPTAPSYWRHIWEDRFSAKFVSKRTHKLNQFLERYGQGLTGGRRLDAASKEFLGL